MIAGASDWGVEKGRCVGKGLEKGLENGEKMVVRRLLYRPEEIGYKVEQRGRRVPPFIRCARSRSALRDLVNRMIRAILNE